MKLFFDLDYMTEDQFQEKYEPAFISDLNLAPGDCIFCHGEKLIDYGAEEIFLFIDSDAAETRNTALDVPMIAWVHDELILQKEDLIGPSWMIDSPFAFTKEYAAEIYAHYHGLPLKIATTARCLIRELTIEDLSDLIELDKSVREDGSFFDKQIIKSYEEEGLSREEAYYVDLKDYVQKNYRMYRCGVYAILEKVTNTFIGITGLVKAKETRNEYTAEISYAILPKYQGQGYAMEAVEAVIREAYSRFDFQKVIAVINKENTASLRFAWGCGIEVMQKDV